MANNYYGPAEFYREKVMNEEMNQSKFTQPKANAAGIGAKAKGLGMGFYAGMGIDTAMNMMNGDNFGTAAVKGAFTGMLWHTFGFMPMMAIELAPAVPAMIESGAKWKKEKQQWWNQQFLPNFGGSYQDTRRALTMRQAGIEAIQGSKLNARSALGGEARLIAGTLHRGG